MIETSSIDLLNESLEEERKLIYEIDALCTGLMELDAESFLYSGDTEKGMKMFEGYLRKQGY